MSLFRTRSIAAPILAFALVGCAAAPGPIVAPLRYGPAPRAADEPFRARPPAWSPALPGLPLPFEITSLSNGIPVVHVPRRGLPTVTIRLVIARGRADVRAPRDTASILEEILESGTAMRSRSDLAEAYARLGAGHSVSCEEDGCALSVTVGSADLDAALGLVAETAIRPRFEPVDFSFVRARWMYDFTNSQYRMRASLSRNVATLLFGRSHPYGFALPPGAHTRDLAVSDIAALHAQLFRPAHAALVVVGDASKEAVAASATRWLSGWTSAAPSLPRPPLQEPEVAARRVVIVDQRERFQCTAWVGVAMPTADDAERAAVAVLARALGGLSSALHEEVRDQSGAAYDFNDVTEDLRGVTVAGFEGELDREKAQEAIKAIVAAVRKARAAGVSAADVDLAKTSLIAEWQARASTPRASPASSPRPWSGERRWASPPGRHASPR